MPIILAKNQGNRKKSIIILIVMVLLGFLGVFSVSSVSAQGTEITVSLDQAEYQVADFTVEEDITILLSGTITVQVDSPQVQVFFGINAPAGWSTYLSLEEETAYFGENIFDFEGWVIPQDNVQKEHEVSVWASADSREFLQIDFESPASDRGNILLNVINNRIKMLFDNPVHQVLPDSDIVNIFTITNAATVADTFTIILDYPESRQAEGWDISLSSDSFDLEPGEAKTFFVNQKVPEDAPEGDYTVRVEVSSEGHAASKGDQSIVTKVRLPETPSPFRIDWMILFMVGFVGFGIGLAAFLGATEVGYFSLISLFLPLYVRLKKKDVLSHFTRGQIFGYIQANPGTHYNAIIQDLRLHNGVGAYHLQVLEREGFIRSLRDGIYKRFYPATMRIPEKRVHLSRIQKDVFEVIQKHPGITQKQISRLMDESKQVVNYHVKILEGAGLIRLERAGRETACFAGKVSYVPEEDVYQLADEQGATQVMRM
jgi:DNA-binding MarR family transcriptional regulator